MNTSGTLVRVIPRARPRCVCGRLPGMQRGSRMRGIATKENAKKEVNEKLPLAGIRVLDMTRVLAGVGRCYFGMMTED